MLFLQTKRGHCLTTNALSHAYTYSTVYRSKSQEQFNLLELNSLHISCFLWAHCSFQWQCCVSMLLYFALDAIWASPQLWTRKDKLWVTCMAADSSREDASALLPLAAHTQTHCQSIPMQTSWDFHPPLEKSTQRLLTPLMGGFQTFKFKFRKNDYHNLQWAQIMYKPTYKKNIYI